MPLLANTFPFSPSGISLIFLLYTRCPECAFGDLDFASSGDGRWDITWRFVPCEESSDQTFLFEGSNEYYWKVRWWWDGASGPDVEKFRFSVLA